MVYNLKWQNVNDYILGTWHNSFVGPGVGNWDWTHIPAIAHRNFSEAWAIVEPWYNSIGRPGNAPDAGPVPTRPQLGRLYYEYYSANYAENLYGFPCGASLWAKDLVFGLNGDWWIGGDGGVCRYSSVYPPTGFAGNLFAPTIGTNVKKLSVDGDGRIWAAVMPDAAGNSGGLSAYEVLGPANTLGHSAHARLELAHRADRHTHLAGQWLEQRHPRHHGQRRARVDGAQHRSQQRPAGDVLAALAATNRYK